MSAIDLLVILTQMLFILLGLVIWRASRLYRDQTRRPIVPTVGVLSATFIGQIPEWNTGFHSPALSRIGLRMLAGRFCAVRAGGAAAQSLPAQADLTPHATNERR